MFQVRAAFSEQVEWKTSAERAREFFKDIRNYAELMPGVVMTSSAIAAISGSDAIVLVTEWPEFAELEPWEPDPVEPDRVELDPVEPELEEPELVPERVPPIEPVPLPVVVSVEEEPVPRLLPLPIVLVPVDPVPLLRPLPVELPPKWFPPPYPPEGGVNGCGAGV